MNFDNRYLMSLPLTVCDLSTDLMPPCDPPLDHQFATLRRPLTSCNGIIHSPMTCTVTDENSNWKKSRSTVSRAPTDPDTWNELSFIQSVEGSANSLDSTEQRSLIYWPTSTLKTFHPYVFDQSPGIEEGTKNGPDSFSSTSDGSPRNYALLESYVNGFHWSSDDEEKVLPQHDDKVLPQQTLWPKLQPHAIAEDKASSSWMTELSLLPSTTLLPSPIVPTQLPLPPTVLNSFDDDVAETRLLSSLSFSSELIDFQCIYSREDEESEERESQRDGGEMDESDEALMRARKLEEEAAREVEESFEQKRNKVAPTKKTRERKQERMDRVREQVKVLRREKEELNARATAVRLKLGVLKEQVRKHLSTHCVIPLPPQITL